MTLYDKLKSLFSSSDTYTVLQLLNEFIETLKDTSVYDVKTYVHVIHILAVDNNTNERLTGSIALCNHSSEAMTWTDFRKAFEDTSIPLVGRYSIGASAFPVVSITTYIVADDIEVYYIDTNAEDEKDTTLAKVSFTDTVHEI